MPRRACQQVRGSAHCCSKNHTSIFLPGPTPDACPPRSPPAADLAEALAAGKLPAEVLQRFLDMDKNPMLAWLMKST
jgi:hypothetical protein